MRVAWLLEMGVSDLSINEKSDFFCLLYFSETHLRQTALWDVS